MIERLQEKQRVDASIAEWLKEFPDDFKKERRLRYLKQQHHWLAHQFSKLLDDDKKANPNFRYWLDKAFDDIHKKMRRLSFEIKLLEGSEDKITPEQIARAREYPITDLIEHRAGFAKCPFHNDHKPSMYLKNNFYHCFVCEANGDVIDFLMKTANISFRDAVDKLS